MASAWATAEANAVAEAGPGAEIAGAAGTLADAEAVAMAWLRVGLTCAQETASCSRLLPRQGRLLVESFILN